MKTIITLFSLMMLHSMAFSQTPYKIICESRGNFPSNDPLDELPRSGPAKLTTAKLDSTNLVFTQNKATPNWPYTIEVPSKEGTLQLIFEASQAKIQFEITIFYLENNIVGEIWATDLVTNLTSSPITDFGNNKWGVSIGDRNTRRGAFVSCKFAN